MHVYIRIVFCKKLYKNKGNKPQETKLWENRCVTISCDLRLFLTSRLRKEGGRGGRDQLS